jgi:hypothetical protein
MQQGFYIYRNNIYYGSYRAEQASGYQNVSLSRPECILTAHPVNKEDRAVRFWENHHLLEPEFTDLQAMIFKMQSFMNLSLNKDIDFSPAEEKLEVPFPVELKLVYTAIFNHKEYFTNVEHFLPLDEIYAEQGIIVFFKKKRVPIAGYDIESGCLAQYYKKEWHIEKNGFCCYQFCVGRMLTIALENKPVFRKGRCKGTFVTTLDIERELIKFCNEQYHLLSEFNAYGIAVMYSNEGLIAWIRSNGFYADIHAGAIDESHLEAFGTYLGQITWQ